MAMDAPTLADLIRQKLQDSADVPYSSSTESDTAIDLIAEAIVEHIDQEATVSGKTADGTLFNEGSTDVN